MPVTDLPDIHVDDVGTELVVLIEDEDGVAVDVAAATTKTIKLKKPGSAGELLTKTAAFDTDGTDGLIKWTTIAGDLDTAGVWKIQGYVEVGGNKWYSKVSEFKVAKNLS